MANALGHRTDTEGVGHLPADCSASWRADERVRVVPRWQLTLERLAKLNRAAPTLGIVASGAAAAIVSNHPDMCITLQSCTAPSLGLSFLYNLFATSLMWLLSRIMNCYVATGFSKQSEASRPPSAANMAHEGLSHTELLTFQVHFISFHLIAGFGASDTSRPTPAIDAAAAGPSRQAVQVQAALGRLRRSSGHGGTCGGAARTSAAEHDGGGGRLNLSAYAALLACVRVLDPSDAAPPTQEGAQLRWVLIAQSAGFCAYGQSC